ncbi:EAL domain-containing protein [Vibrio splendidus]|uniref:EAL domain-containing protein n=1 Tax=Vibrio splendidus TaxID=29497 RepID=UPI002235915B|nr:EAL domain-containing protein [Vibrio splendidus]MCW4438864.1 EAL domain-containing protein [Vibrio splendidus]
MDIKDGRLKMGDETVLEEKFLTFNENEFSLVDLDLIDMDYQPIFGASNTKKTISFELLLRYRDPLVGVMYPSKFIPLIIRSGYLHRMTIITLQKAIDDLNKLITINENVQVSLNVSSLSIDDQGTRDWIVDFLIKNERLVRDRLTIEITETEYVSIDRLSAFIPLLKKTGVRLSLDDFGISHSTFELFMDIPFDELKIDRKFVSKINKNKKSKYIVGSIVDMCKKLNVSVVAEGVEEEEEFNTLIKMGVENFQGFYLSKPMRFYEVNRYLGVCKD